MLKKGNIPWNKGKKGYKLSDTHRQNISKSLKGNKYTKGFEYSKVTKLKLSEYHKNNPRSPWLNKKQPLEMIEKRTSKFRGENHWRWIEDRSKVNPKNNERNTPQSKKWRSDILTRDNWTCQTCGVYGSGRLETHHIKSWSKFPELRFELSNGVTLCRECHKLTDNYGGKNNAK